MPFSELLTDTVSILKKNGERVDGVKSSVQSSRIFIDRADVLIEPLDLIQRKMSNGGEETFEVIDPGFHEAFHGIPAGYQMHVKKLGLPEAKKAIQSITFNVSGPNARINQHSIDQSVNYATNENTEAFKYLASLREELKKLPADKRQEAEEIADEIENGIRSGGKKSVVAALISALPNMGNIASIGSFILQCLSK